MVNYPLLTNNSKFPDQQHDSPSLLCQPALHPDRHDPLQRRDLPNPCTAETAADMHGTQHQHWSCLSPQGLRDTRPVSEGFESPETGQVGYLSTYCLLATGQYRGQSLISMDDYMKKILLEYY